MRRRQTSHDGAGGLKVKDNSRNVQVSGSRAMSYKMLTALENLRPDLPLEWLMKLRRWKDFLINTSGSSLGRARGEELRAYLEKRGVHINWPSPTIPEACKVLPKAPPGRGTERA